MPANNRPPSERPLRFSPIAAGALETRPVELVEMRRQARRGPTAGGVRRECGGGEREPSHGGLEGRRRG